MTKTSYIASYLTVYTFVSDLTILRIMNVFHGLIVYSVCYTTACNYSYSCKLSTNEPCDCVGSCVAPY